MGSPGIDVHTQTPQVTVKEEHEVRRYTQRISSFIYRLSHGVKVLGALPWRKSSQRNGHVNSPDLGQPTTEANDQVGTNTQDSSGKSNDLPADKTKYYVPQMFSLGPLYQLPHTEHEKSKKIKNELLTHYGDLKELVNIMSSEGVTRRIREWYDRCHCSYSSEELCLVKMDGYSDKHLGLMMAQDGLFLLNFLRWFGRSPQCDRYTRSLSSRPREIPTNLFGNADGCFRQLERQFAMQEDVMKIVNQIPFFVLQKTLQWEKDNLIHPDQHLVSILKQALSNLSPILYTCDSHDSHARAGVQLKEESHLLEFVYENIINSSDFKARKKNRNKRRKSKKGDICLPRAADLKEKGVKFAANRGVLNEIHFDRRNRTLYLPAIEMYSQTDAVLRNLVRFEGSKKEEESQPLMSYVDLMERLIDKADDVQALTDGRVIHKHLSTYDDVADVWNGMRMALSPRREFRYEPIDSATYEVKSFYTSKRRVMCTEFKRKYCSKPWIVISVISACILLGLSIIQTLLAWEQVRLQIESMHKI